MELFDNSTQALIYAFRFSSQQYALSPMAKLMKSGVTSSGKGLVALDGAAQAGFILAAVERVGRVNALLKCCLVARYSLRYVPCPCCRNDKMIEEYEIAIANLQEAVASHGIVTGMSHRLMRETIVRRFFEKSISINKVADRIKVPRRTAYDQKARIWAWLTKLDAEAQKLVDEILDPKPQQQGQQS